MTAPPPRTSSKRRETPGPGGSAYTGTALLQRYDVGTGRLTGTIDSRKVGLGQFDEVQWSGPSGRVLVSLLPGRLRHTGPGISTERTAAIFVGKRLYPVPWFRTAIEAAW